MTMKTFISLFFLLPALTAIGAIPPPIQSTQLTTNVAKASPSNSVFRVTNSVTGMGDWVLLPSASSGGASNAVSTIQSNGVTVTTSATNLNLSDGTNVAWKITNSPDGNVSVSAHLNPAVTTGASNYTDARLGGFVQNLNGQATNLTVKSAAGTSGALTVNTNELVLTNGVAGIGTNDPQATLHVVGNGSNTNLLSVGTVQTNNLFNVDTNGNAWTYRGFRRETNSVYQDDEFVTEAHLQEAILELQGATYFLQTNAHPVISGTRATRLDRETDQWLTNALGVGSNLVAIWFSTNFVSGGVIPSGPYDLHIHAAKSSAGPGIYIGFDIVRTNGLGIVTVLSGETNIMPGDIIEHDFNLGAIITTPLVVSPTDYIGVRFYAVRTAGAVSLFTHVGGTTDSHFNTPSLGGGSGSTTIDVRTNGVSANSTANIINFVKGTNTQVLATNMGSGVVDVSVQATGGGGLTFSQSSITSTNPMVIDLDGTIFQTVELTNDAFFQATNLAAAKIVKVKVEAGSTNRLLSFIPEWRFNSAELPSILESNRSAMLTVQSWGTTNQTVTVDWKYLYSSLWTPSNMDFYPMLWYDPDALTGASNSAVSLWTDKGALLNNLVQGTGAQQPVLYTNFLNSKSVVLFDPTSTRRRLTLFSAATNINYTRVTFLAVVCPLAYGAMTSPNQGYSANAIWANGHAGQGTDVGFGVGAVGGIPRFVNYSETTALYTIDTTNLAAVGNWYIASSVMNGATATTASYTKLYVNGLELNSQSTAAGVSGNLNDSLMGDEPTFGVNAYNGYVAEFIVCSNILDSVVTAKTEGYFAHKFGLQNTLPKNHPYKKSAPMF